MVPIDVLLIPVFLNLLSEKLFHLVDLAFLRHHQHVLALFQDCVSVRNDDYALVSVVFISSGKFPHPGHHQMGMNPSHYGLYVLSENRRISHAQFRHESRILVHRLRRLPALTKHRTKDYDG